MSTPPGFVFPVQIGPQGLVPQSPNSLLTQLIANATALSPGLTANLPGSMIEDISSTDVAAIALSDQAKVELVNSLTSLAANVFTLQQLGQMAGVYLGQPTNTSVNLIFTGTIGYVIANGFLVSDGTNSYAVQTGGVITNTGMSAAITAIAINPGTFAVPANTVTQLRTSVPLTITLTVTNPNPGNPGGTQETYFAYRTRVLQAGLAACVGGPRFIKTAIGVVLGAQANLISVQPSAGGIRIVVGGSANSFDIAFAIFSSVGDIGVLLGSAINSGRNVTVSLLDYPDTYAVTYVGAVQQTVSVNVTWNTTLTNFTGGGAFPSLVQQPLVDYINALGVGQVINIFEMNEIFQDAVAAVLSPAYLTRLVFSVSINGTPTPPGTGTGAVSGDPEGYFFALASGVTVEQG